MTEINQTAPVLVTGASGYIAGWLIKKLLDEGFTVHATVRDPSNEKKIAPVKALAADKPEKLKYFAAELLDEGAYDKAMQGCELVFHMASPFVIGVDDAQRDLVDPAVNGTANVLNSANRTDSVKRVVLTSSCASIYGDAQDVENKPGGVFNEEDWNTTSSLTHQEYSYSKVAAERKAWEIAEAQDRWDLVVINPSFVLGPSIDPQINCESFTQIIQHGDGTNKGGIPEVPMGTVDVREVAEAHFKAGFTPSASGRYICHGKDSNFLEIGQVLHKKYGNEYPIGNKKVPKFLLWLVAPIVTKGVVSRKFVSKNVGFDLKVDNAKSKRELGMTYRPQEETLYEMFDQLIEAGRV